MKRILFVLLAIATSAGAMAQKYSDSTYIIGEGHVGKIQINMDQQKLNSFFDASQIKTTTKSAEGDEYSVINVTLTGETKPSLDMETMCMDICLITRINVYSAKYKTVKGIGVGSEIGDLKKVYTIKSVIGGENGIMVYIDDINQTAFVVDVPAVKSTPGKTIPVSSIPDQTKIKSVYMY